MGNRKSMPNAKTEYFDRISCFSYLMQTWGRSENVPQFSIHATIYVPNIMFSDIIYINLTFLLLFFRVVIQSNNNIYSDKTPHCCNFTINHKRAEDGC